MKTLTMLDDGVDGIEIGDCGGFQWALRIKPGWPKHHNSGVVKRLAPTQFGNTTTNASRYGGWRYEGTAEHLERYDIPEGIADLISTVLHSGGSRR